jgi:hypothetical protein
MIFGIPEGEQLQKLNEIEIIYPGSDMQLIYKLGVGYWIENQFRCQRTSSN